MPNIFYQIAINSKIQQLDFLKCFSQAEKQHKVLRDISELNNRLEQFSGTEGPDTPIFLAVSEKPEIYVAFYKNLYFTYSYDKELRDTIFRIYIKRPEDKWEIPTKSNGKTLDAVAPTNVKAEIYVNYNETAHLQ